MKWMLIGTMLSGLIFSGCAMAPESEPVAQEPQNAIADDAGGSGTAGGVSMNILRTGTLGRLASGESDGGRRAPWVEVATTPEQYRNLWSQYVSDQPAPEVNLSGSAVIFLLLGPQSTGGYAIEPHGVSREGSTLQVDATLHQPGQGSIVTQAFTAPFAVLSVSTNDFSTVDWMNQGRLLARKSMR